MLSCKERNKIRDIQDRVIRILEKKGFKKHDEIVQNITLQNLRDVIYPEFYGRFVEYLDEWKEQ